MSASPCNGPTSIGGARQIRKTGKGGKLVTVPITPSIREILLPLRGNDPAHVTYIAQRSIDKIVKGKLTSSSPASAIR